MINVETSSSKYKLNLNNLIMNSKISLKKTSSFGSNYHAAEWLMGILGKNRLIKTTLEEPCQFTTLKIRNLINTAMIRILGKVVMLGPVN